MFFEKNNLTYRIIRITNSKINYYIKNLLPTYITSI